VSGCISLSAETRLAGVMLEIISKSASFEAERETYMRNILSWLGKK
jgi:hypothetical protein